MDLRPIFIGGLAHSGKTPLRLMLSSHPNIAMTRRTYFWTRFYNRFGDLADSENFERCLSAIMQHKHVRMLDPDSGEIRRDFWRGPPTYAHLFALFQAQYAVRLGKPRWGDQLGFIERYADPIFSAFPLARMIHMVREPGDRYEVSATRTRHRPGKVGWATAGWLDSVALMRKNLQRYPDRYKVVHHEMLVSQPEETVREVCAFLEEDFVPTMITMEDAIRFGNILEQNTDHRPKSFAVPTKSEKFSTKVMSKRELAFIQNVTKPASLALGYSVTPTQLSLHERLCFYLIDWPINRAGMLAWQTLHGRQLA